MFDEVKAPSFQSEDPWRMFRIIAEFAEGFDKMAHLGPAVAFFGSAASSVKGTKYYNLTEEIAKKVAEKGFGVITGGSFGMMEAANKGAQEVGGKSCGLCITLPSEETHNPYVDPKHLLNFRYFFVRKVMFVKYALAFVIVPGGFGTMDEFFEALTLIQTNKIKKFPVFLVGKDYWEGLLKWLRGAAVEYGTIKPEHLDLITITEDAQEIADKIEEHYKEMTTLENF